MRQGTIIPLDEALALDAALFSHELKLSMADSIILATARRHDALLRTKDAHFKGVEGVQYRLKQYT